MRISIVRWRVEQDEQTPEPQSERLVESDLVAVLNADLPGLDDLEILQVDEKSIRKGHGYMTGAPHDSPMEKMGN